MIRIFLIFLTCVYLCQELRAQEGREKLYKIYYIIEQGDTLAKIYKRFVYLDSLITKNTLMTKKTMKMNPHISDWKKLTPGILIRVYIAEEYMDLSKYQVYVEDQKDTLNRIQNFGDENTLANHLPKGLKMSFFYMASQGRFAQRDPKRAEVEFYQNSPVTLGASLSYFPDKSLWSFSASIYASYLIAASNNLNADNVTVAPETGTTFYNEYRFEKQNFTGYFGVDYENFSTFNMGGIQEKRKILLDRNTVAYATVGVAKLVYIFESPYFTKLSLSKSVSSAIEANPSGIDSSGAYDGYKVLWYLNKKVSERVYLHTLFKYHWMKGPSELSTVRIGLGFGYIFQ